MNRAFLEIKVIPRARQEGIVGVRDGIVVIKVISAPEKGKANERVRTLLSQHLKIPLSNITLVQGGASRHKKFCIMGLDPEKVISCFH